MTAPVAHAHEPGLATARLLINAALGTIMAGSHVRASLLVRQLGPSLLFPRLDTQSRQALLAFYMGAWYATSRLLYWDTRWIARLLLRFLRHMRATRLFVALVCAGVAVDELVHTLVVAILDGRRELRGQSRPLPLRKPVLDEAPAPQQMPESAAKINPVDDDDVCCICQESDSPVEALLNYCSRCAFHFNHPSCIKAWFLSNQASAKLCPVCRALLRTHAPPVPQRILFYISSPAYYRRLPFRVLATVGCSAFSLFIMWIMANLRKRGLVPIARGS